MEKSKTVKKIVTKNTSRATMPTKQKKNEKISTAKDILAGAMENCKKDLPKLLEKKQNELAEILQKYAPIKELHKTRDGVRTIYKSSREDGIILTENEIIDLVFTPPFNANGMKLKYNALELDMLFNAYKNRITLLEKNNQDFVPTLESFCMFCDISTQTFRRLIDNNDEGIRELCEKISDWLVIKTDCMGLKGQQVLSMFWSKTKYGRRETDVQIMPNNNTVVITDAENIQKMFGIKNLPQIEEKL